MANYPIHIYVDHIKRYWPISARTRTRNNWRTLRSIKCITNQLPTGQNEFCQTLVTKLLLTVAQPRQEVLVLLFAKTHVVLESSIFIIVLEKT